jgi:hypothetical protein
VKALIRNAALLALFGGCIWLVWKAKSSVHVPGAQEFIKKYFDTWSRHDMNAYSQTFDSRARVFVEEPGATKTELGLQTFLEMQRAMLAKYATASEEATSINVTSKEADGTVSAEARWLLRVADKHFTGTDYFKLKQTEGRWAILELSVRNDTPIQLP